MSREEKEFAREITSDQISEKEIYYESGYLFAPPKLPVKTLDYDISIYLLLISIVLFFVFRINQLLTILFLLIFIARDRIFTDSNNRDIDGLLLIFVLLGSITDHFISSIQILPGEIVSDQLGIIEWILEILWIIFFGIELLIIFQPITKPIEEERTVTFGNIEAVERFGSLEERISGGQYEIEDLDTSIDIKLLRDKFVDLIKYLVVILVVIIIIDLIIWEIISGISGGKNIEEAYFVSGLSLILYSILLAFSPVLLGWNDKSGISVDKEKVIN